MSTTVDTPTPATASRPRPSAAPRPRGRMAIAVALVGSLLVSGALQQWAFSYRAAAMARKAHPGAPSAPPRLANLDSYSLALLLGGLRGPLVMFLWSSSESQKGEKDLESFDTKVELIRLLQPEFDTVHLFQIWNKIYNVSAQLASLANKYAAILDGVEYAKRVEEADPDNINIVSAIGGAFSEKLGNSAEKDYYRRRVRTETLPVYRATFPSTAIDAFKKAVADAGADVANVRISNDAATGASVAVLDKLLGDRVLASFKAAGVNATPVPRQSLRPEARGGRRYELDTLLDVNGNILPEHLKPTRTLSPGVEDNDGAALQYLAPFQPFTYGLSPLALGYNYHKRAQLLVRVGRQKHQQLSEMVMDSQPAMALKGWIDEEQDRGRRLELRGLPRAAGADARPRDLQTSAIGTEAKVVDRAAIDEAIFSYARAVQVGEAALPEFAGHIALYPNKLQNYFSHQDNIRAIIHMSKADAAYLRGMLAANQEERRALLATARSEYAQAARWYLLLILKYYVSEPDATAARYALSEVENKTLDEMRVLFDRTKANMEKRYKGVINAINGQHILEYEESVRRADARMSLLK